jgi:hypothetical protein
MADPDKHATETSGSAMASVENSRQRASVAFARRFGSLVIFPTRVKGQHTNRENQDEVVIHIKIEGGMRQPMFQCRTQPNWKVAEERQRVDRCEPQKARF